MAELTILVDDLDGSRDNVQRLAFGLDDEWYEIDLGPHNQDRLRELLHPYLIKARPEPLLKFRRKRRPKPRDVLNDQGLTPDDRAAVRAWARAQGYEVRDQGRIPQDIVDKWQEARDIGGH